MIVIDPVCKMEVETEGAQWTHEHDGKMYYFCSPGCMSSFSKEPVKYLSPDFKGVPMDMDDDDHEGHDHADHEGHDHAEHEEHDHADHEGHDH